MAGTRRSNAQRLRDALEDDIVNGRLRPGDRLDPEQLSERFGVSRTPVREAIQQLSASGLVRVAPKRGTFVTEIGLPQLIEMFEVMAELEGMCGRLAAGRIDADAAESLRAALARCREAAGRGDSDDYYYENEHFHHCIYDATGNAFLAAEARRLQARLMPYRRLQLRVRRRVRRSVEEHEAIVEAILDGDAARAERRLNEHVLVQGERFTDLVASVHASTAASDAPAAVKS